MSDIKGLWDRRDYKNPTLIYTALEYAKLGLRVIPLNGKTPFMERWPQRATTDQNQVAQWFQSWPNKNISIVTGAGIIALDVDPRNGGTRSFPKLVKGRKFPTTATALTGSGGNHYLFRVDPTLRIADTTGFQPGIDIKGDCGRSSIHPNTGRGYG